MKTDHLGYHYFKNHNNKNIISSEKLITKENRRTDFIIMITKLQRFLHCTLLFQESCPDQKYPLKT